MKYEVVYEGKVVVVHAEAEYEAKMKACVHFGLKGAECLKLKVAPAKEVPAAKA